MRYFHRRALLAALAGGAVASWLSVALAQQNISERRAIDGALQITLREMLAKGLKARRPQEFAYVDRVVAFVDSGDLPRKEVEQVFLWARQQQRYPFQYFQFAMSKKARRYGVKL